MYLWLSTHWQDYTPPAGNALSGNSPKKPAFTRKPWLKLVILG